jgi:hypothetical protein
MNLLEILRESEKETAEFIKLCEEMKRTLR